MKNDNPKGKPASAASPTPPLVEWAEGLLWLIALFWIVAVLAFFISPWLPGETSWLAIWATIFTVFSWPFGLCLLIIELVRTPARRAAWWLFLIYLVIAAILIWPIGITLAPLGSGVV